MPRARAPNVPLKQRFENNRGKTIAEPRQPSVGLIFRGNHSGGHTAVGSVISFW